MKLLNLKFLCLCMCLFSCIKAFSYDALIDGIYYNLIESEGQAEVTSGYSGYLGCYRGTVTIPETVSHNGETYFVTSIGSRAFLDCPNLTSVSIPNSVTSIGEKAFCDCSGLTSITIPNSVTSIGGGAFDSCTGLKKVIVTDIAAWCGIAFDDYLANPLYYAKLLYSDETTEITNLIIPNSVTSIGDHAFYDCPNLISVSIPNSVTSIGEKAFDSCSGLTSVTIPNSVTSIEWCAFQGCSGLTSVTIGNSVTSIGGCAFNHCSGLTSVTIGNSVTNIEYNAFSWCSGLTSVTIPNSVTSIGPYAFEGCSALTSIEVESGNRTYDSRNNCNAIIETATNTLITGCKNTTIPNSVTSIENNAFDGCSGLTSVTIPNSVTSIGWTAFRDCSGLTSVTIPNSVTSIGPYAFDGCSGLTSVTIPNSVTSIGGCAFQGCSGLTSIEVESGNRTYDSRNNCNAIIETATNTLIQGCENTIIPNSVTSIGSSAFSGCSGLTSVTIPNSVTSIEGAAFYGCSGLTSVTIGNSVKEIGSTAFAYCKELTDVYCYAESVPSTYSPYSPYVDVTFVDSNIKYATLYVPAVSIEQYMVTEPWSNFGAIVPLTDEDAIAEVQAVPVLIQTQGNTITVQGAEAGTEIILYGANGVQLDSVIATTGTASLNTSRLSGSVAIVKIGNKTVKVLVKQ